MILSNQPIRMMGFLTEAPVFSDLTAEVTMTVRPYKPGPIALLVGKSTDHRIGRFARHLVKDEAVVLDVDPSGEIRSLETWLPQSRAA